MQCGVAAPMHDWQGSLPLSLCDNQELKSLQKPPSECLEVTKAVLIMRGEGKNTEWKAAQKMMSDPGKFLDQVLRCISEKRWTSCKVHGLLIS